jgi:hypothetical protein
MVDGTVGIYRSKKIQLSLHCSSLRLQQVHRNLDNKKTYIVLIFFPFQVNEQLIKLNLSGNQFCEEGGVLLGPSISEYALL